MFFVLEKREEEEVEDLKLEHDKWILLWGTSGTVT